MNFFILQNKLLLKLTLTGWLPIKTLKLHLFNHLDYTLSSNLQYFIISYL